MSERKVRSRLRAIVVPLLVAFAILGLGAALRGIFHPPGAGSEGGARPLESQSKQGYYVTLLVTLPILLGALALIIYLACGKPAAPRDDAGDQENPAEPAAKCPSCGAPIDPMTGEGTTPSGSEQKPWELSCKSCGARVDVAP